MNLKTITAGSMAEALKLVKREIGDDALVLHTRSYKQGGFLGFGARPVVEVTAGDREAILRARGQKRRPQAPRKPGSPEKTGGKVAASPSSHEDRARQLLAQAQRLRRSDASGGDLPLFSGYAAPDSGPVSSTATVEPTAGDLIRRTYAAARAELQGARGASPVASPAAPVVPDPTQLANEMRSVRELVETFMRQQKRQSRVPDVPKPLFDEYLSLIEQEVSEDLASEIVQQVRNQLGDGPVDAAAVREHVCRQLASLVPGQTEGLHLEPTADGRPRTIALIGPTGVGKTTTLAKLAATFKLKQGKSVGMITLDTYRIAAVDQLRTYANIIGVPLHVAMNEEELASALNKLKGCDVILMDTAGRSQRDDDRLQQLQRFLDVADPHEVHLVLSSTCSESVMLEAADRFGSIRADQIIFTKLDEAVSFGVLFNVARHVNKRLSYVTTGQEVPHDIEPGRPDRLAELVLGARV